MTHPTADTVPAPMAVPPWARMLQAHADHAEADRATARDITNGVYEEVVGPRRATHRKDQA